MTAKLATVDDRILASVEDAAAVRDGNILQHRASDKQRVGSLQFGCGYLSPYAVTDPERMEVVFEDAYVLIHEKRISSKSDLIQILEQITKSGKPLLIIRRGCWRRGAQGHVANGVVRTKLTLMHEDIAHLIGTSLETITRTLSEFSKKDIVELKGSTLIIHDKVALGRLVTA